MASLVQRGSVVSLGSYVLTQVLRLGSNLILTRLLFQEVFGLTALIQVVLVGLHLFSDVGIGPSIVQNEKGAKPEFLDTAFTVQLAKAPIQLGCIRRHRSALIHDELQRLFERACRLTELPLRQTDINQHKGRADRVRNIAG